MNILHINTVEHIGGAAKVMTRLLFKQREKGHIVRVLIDGTHTLPKPISETESCPRTAAKILDHPYVKEADVVHLHNLHGGNYFDLNVLPKLSKQKKIVLTLHDMWAFTGHCCHAMACTEWKTGCKVCHHLDYNEHIDDDCAGNLFRHKKYNYDKSNLIVICPSNWMLRLVKESVLGRFQCIRIPNALDTDVFSIAKDKVFCKQRLGLPLDKFIIGASAAGGVLSSGYKGGNYTLDVIRRLSESDVIFVDFGSDKDSRTGNIYHIQYTNDESELALRYNALDIALHTPIAENFALILIEFAACGIPIVGFDTGGMPEQIIDGKTGFVISNKDCEQTTKAIYRLKSDRGLVQSMGEEARTFAEQNFGLEQQYQQYLQAYELK